jgi:signal transduction histidine kinase
MTTALPPFHPATPGFDGIAALRHELRSPLAAVTALIGTLAAEDLSDDRRREIAHLAYWQARHMAAVLHGTAAGRGTLVEVVAAAGVAAGLTVSRLRTDLTAEAAGTAVDAQPMQQLLTNLLNNAARHGTPDGEIALAASVDTDALVLTVRNRLAVDYRPGPPGYGLRIVRRIVERNHGHLELLRTGEVMTVRATLRPAG